MNEGKKLTCQYQYFQEGKVVSCEEVCQLKKKNVFKKQIMTHIDTNCFTE